MRTVLLFLSMFLVTTVPAGPVYALKFRIFDYFGH